MYNTRKQRSRPLTIRGREEKTTKRFPNAVCLYVVFYRRKERMRRRRKKTLVFLYSNIHTNATKNENKLAVESTRNPQTFSLFFEKKTYIKTRGGKLCAFIHLRKLYTQTTTYIIYCAITYSYIRTYTHSPVLCKQILYYKILLLYLLYYIS